MNTVDLVVSSGVALFLLLTFEFLVGRRTIHFKGRLHRRVHRWVAWTLMFAALGHGLFAVHTFLGWPF